MVNTTCAVRECLSSSRTNKDVRFHQFPLADERIKQWLEACDRVDLFTRSLESLRHTYVCSLHFEPRMYGKKILKKHAVPTLHMPPKGKTSVFTQTDTLELLKRNPNNSTALVIDLDARAVICRVFYYLRQEYEDNKSLTDNSSVLDPLTNILQRTASATGVNVVLVKHILDQELLLGNKNHAASEQQMRVHLQRSAMADRAQLQPHGETSTSSRETPSEPEQVMDRSSSPTDLVNEPEVTVKIENDYHGGPVDSDPLDSRSDPTGHHDTASDVKAEPADDNQPKQEHDILQNSAGHPSFSLIAHTTLDIEPTVVGISQVSGASMASASNLSTTNLSVNLETLSPVRKKIKVEKEWAATAEAGPLHQIKVEEHLDQLRQTDTEMSNK